ncbi:MAG: hypothetical protein LBT06_10805 [Hungatella sp.]|jgi:hypothetical protein|nr:hypothetical protein [Hungatella sp.]
MRRVQCGMDFINYLRHNSDQRKAFTILITASVGFVVILTLGINLTKGEDYQIIMIDEKEVANDQNIKDEQQS